MKNIYKGNLRNLVIKKLEIQGDNIKILEYEKPIVKKDLLFYAGFMGSYISFDYGTRLPDEYEALDYVKAILDEKETIEAPYPECIFINNDEIKLSHQVCNENFRSIKKYYKQINKEAEVEKRKRSI